MALKLPKLPNILKRKKDGEQAEDAKPKKKVKKSDIAQNIAFGILGIVMGLVACILLCAANPDLTKMISDIVSSGKKVEEPEKKTPKYVIQDNIDEIVNATYTPKLEETEEKTVEDTQNASDSDNASASETVQGEASAETPQEEISTEDVQDASSAEASQDEAASVQPLIMVKKTENNPDGTVPEETEVVETTEDAVPEYTPQVVRGKSNYVETTPDIVNVDNEKQARQIENGVGYGETGEGLDFSSEYYPYYQLLSDELKPLYRQVYANAMALNTSFKPVKDANMNDIKNVIESVSYDHPQIFWLNTTFYTEFDYNGNAIKIVLSFYDRLGNLDQAKQDFENSVNELLQGALALSSDAEKELYVHNLLAQKLNYKHNSLDQSAYSGIVGDYTVCAGYAKAFQYLMQRLGIPAYLCVGQGANELHAWNIVKIDGQYYNVDCTWDDQDPTVFDYYNLSDRMNYMHTRMFQSVGLPPCEGTSALIISFAGE